MTLQSHQTSFRMLELIGNMSLLSGYCRTQNLHLEDSADRLAASMGKVHGIPFSYPSLVSSIC